MKYNSIYKLIILLLFIHMAGHTFAQRGMINYKVLDADVNTTTGFAQAFAGMNLGTTAGLGFDAGLIGYQRLESLPFTFRGRFNVEFAGLATVEEYGRGRELDLGMMFPLISGRAKSGRVKVGTGSSQHIYVDGQVKRDLLVRAGPYRAWTADGFSATGITGGLTFQLLKHAKIELAGEEGYYRDTDTMFSIYADVIYAPSIKNERLSSTNKLGGKIGLLANEENSGYFVELSVRPGYLIYISYGMSFGLHW
ncbi:MAG: hypothetical protein RIA69_03915 [Cyclobacteriaceae bacterium]